MNLNENEENKKLDINPLKIDEKRINNIIKLTLKEKIIWKKDFYSIFNLYLGLYVGEDIKIFFKAGNFPYLEIIKDKDKNKSLFIGRQYKDLLKTIKRKTKKFVDDDDYDFLLIDYLKTAKDSELNFYRNYWKENNYG